MAKQRYNVLTVTNHGAMIVNRFDRWVGNHLSAYGVWDARLQQLLAGLVQERRRNTQGRIVAVDIGANVGAIALPLARAIGDRGIVHAFEPQRLIYYMLCGNVALASMENLHCHRLALSDAPGQVELACYQLDRTVNIGGFKVDSSIESSFDGVPTGETETVEVTTLDRFPLQGLDILKIDVEGMEPKVLQGAQASIDRFRPAILFEAWNGPGEFLRQFFAARDYRLYAMGDDTLALPAGKFDLVVKGQEIALR